MDESANLTRQLETVRSVREELKLKAHLAKREIKDELERLERKWLHVEKELRRTDLHARQDVRALGKSAKELLLDLKQGYESVKRRLV